MSITPEVSAKTLTQLVATEIRVQMARADVRQSQLAREIDKTEQWLSVRLRGRQPIDLNDLALIARALNVGVHELLPPPAVVAAAVNGLSRGAGSGRRGNDLNDSSCSLIPSAVDRPAKAPRPPVRANRHTVIGNGPYGGGRRDATRPVSAVPFSSRRPARMGPGNRPIPT